VNVEDKPRKPAIKMAGGRAPDQRAGREDGLSRMTKLGSKGIFFLTFVMRAALNGTVVVQGSLENRCI
jgi:hypothetical protein